MSSTYAYLDVHDVDATSAVNTLLIFEYNWFESAAVWHRAHNARHSRRSCHPL